jgi:NOL1/NOP2/fmu family ribosome biogenesis protein
MERWGILNKKAAEDIIAQMDEQWGAHIEGDYQYLLTAKSRVYIVHKDVAKINFRALRIDAMGLYVAEIKKGQIRLSIEGSQLVGPKATKNVVDVDKETAIDWLRGADISVGNGGDGEQFSGFAIVKHGTDYLGSGKYVDGVLLNHVPKARRLLTSDVAS